MNFKSVNITDIVISERTMSFAHYGVIYFAFGAL